VLERYADRSILVLGMGRGLRRELDRQEIENPLRGAMIEDTSDFKRHD